jgi:ubiquinone biosynthesis monooxygenase Coq7
MPRKSLTGLDLLWAAADRALHTLAAPASAQRPNPAQAEVSAELADGERRQVAALMRINHAGEVAAQALYHGQALTARNPQLRETLRDAADEEGDHLAWCDERLRELGSRPSLLNPLWYAGSFAIGALAGACGDRVSLGFLVETERQVEGHLEDHLARLPAADARSRRVLEQMKCDEIRHSNTAHSAGAAELPGPVKLLMKLTSRVMTRTAYWL